jgi:hypothetical protein
MTTESQRQQAETIAAEMAKLPGIASAVVDDWDDFGGFNLFIRLTTAGSNSQFIKFLVPLNGIVLKLRSIAHRHGAEWEWHQPPKRLYSSAGPRQRKYWDGYDTDSYKLSLKV